jgi:hypothetical protein
VWNPKPKRQQVLQRMRRRSKITSDCLAFRSL